MNFVWVSCIYFINPAKTSKWWKFEVALGFGGLERYLEMMCLLCPFVIVHLTAMYVHFVVKARALPGFSTGGVMCHILEIRKLFILNSNNK